MYLWFWNFSQIVIESSIHAQLVQTQNETSFPNPLTAVEPPK